jgi:hypothetical protein
MSKCQIAQCEKPFMGDDDNPRTIQPTTKSEGIMYWVIQMLERLYLGDTD